VNHTTTRTTKRLYYRLVSVTGNTTTLVTPPAAGTYRIGGGAAAPATRRAWRHLTGIRADATAEAVTLAVTWTDDVVSNSAITTHGLAGAARSTLSAAQVASGSITGATSPTTVFAPATGVEGLQGVAVIAWAWQVALASMLIIAAHAAMVLVWGLWCHLVWLWNSPAAR